jgi:LTXXQ motif family protein
MTPWRPEVAVSKSRIAVALVVLVGLISSPATARVHVGGPLAGARFALVRLFSFGGLRHAHSVARHHHVRRAVFKSHQRPKAMEAGQPPARPATREQTTAAAALAGWHGGRAANAWWGHWDGTYGWVGPLFWPFAYRDIYDYIVWADGKRLWDYGYGDISAGIFAPYGADELAAYTEATPSDQKRGRLPQLQQLCGAESRETPGLPIDRIEEAIQPNEAQRAALDNLAKAMISSAELISSSCPRQAVFTAPERLTVMQQRIDAMIKAELALQEPLEKFYGQLSGEQKMRIDALAQERGNVPAANGANKQAANACDAVQPAARQWPSDQIEAGLHLNDTQRAALEVLQDAAARAVDILSTECRPEEAITLPARLMALDRRLDSLQQAVNLVSAALDDFYATLTDEQKARFEAIGPKRTA